MNRLSSNLSKAVASTATALFFFGSSFICSPDISAAKKKSPAIPDFAYPKTVIENADKSFRQALSTDDWNKAVTAMIQKVTAANMVSRDSVTRNLAVLDSVAKAAPSPIKPVLYLIEADVYNSVYNFIRWKADSRQLPADSFPPNPFEWSRDMFADKVYDLSKMALSIRDNDGKPLKTWSSFLTEGDMAYKYGMTADEFIIWKSTSVLSPFADETQDVIPFFAETGDPTTPGQRCRRLRTDALDMLIEKSAARGQNMIEALALSTKGTVIPYSQRGRFLISALDRLKDTEGSQIILQDLQSEVLPDDVKPERDFQLSRERYVGMLRQSVRQFPNGQYANALKNILANLTAPTANVQYRSQYLTSSDIRMDVELSNCNDSWILVYDYSKYLNARQAPSNKTVAANCRLVKAAKVSASGVTPFSAKVVAEIGKLPAGYYVVLPSSTADRRGLYPEVANQSWRQPFSVSDISVMTLNNLDSTTRVFVVDGKNGRPIKDAKVKVYTRKNYSAPKQLVKTLTTDADGSVTVNEKNFMVEAEYDDSKWASDMRIYNTMQKQDTATRRLVSILPDRSIYHPGDSIGAVFVAYTRSGNDMRLDPGCEYDINILNANGKKVATQTAATDRYGRAAVNFLIPEEGLLGQWSLSATGKDGRNYGFAGFQVADYVAPTFFISTDREKNEVTAGDVVNLKGQVLTYSGMPVTDATVSYTVSYRPPMRWFSRSYATYSSSVTSDADGRYTITLPTANLKGTQFERGVFSVQISATSPAGETQSGPAEQFAIGQEYSIRPMISSPKIEISDSIPALCFKVSDILGESVEKKLKYTMVNKATGATVAEGIFESPLLHLPAGDYPSAKYDINVSLADDSEVKAEVAVVMWRASDQAAPAGVGIWLPQTVFHQTPGTQSAEVTVGSGIADRWIPTVLSGGNRVKEFKWIHIESDNQSLTIPYPEGNDCNSLNACLMSDLDTEYATVTFYSAQSDDKLAVATESFRDKVSAGDRQNWRFRFSKKYSRTGKIPVMAVMTDAALNHIAPFKWDFSPLAIEPGAFASFRFDRNDTRSFYYRLRNNKYMSWRALYMPTFDNYGFNWGIGYQSDGIAYVTGITNEVFHSVETTSRSLGSSMKMAAAAKMENADMVLEEAETEDMAAAPAAGGIGEDGGTAENTSELRESECPIAFFMPYLTTDTDGVVDIDFTVPNFNTTWAVQVLGYDESLQTAYKSMETVASKPVMVSSHAPRFVRTGDAIRLTATIFNNTGETSSVKGRIELVNLLDGRLIAARDYAAENVKALGNRIVAMDWTVPSGVSSVGFRAYAEAGAHRDGEQALLPVLPASSPVVESTPFWLAPGQSVFEIKLPKFKDSDQITLQYCDNPAWFCLTALPDIMQTDSKSVTSKMMALYGNAMAYNLISSDASLKKGLEALLSDKDSQYAALKSNLEKDGNLKISKLSNTPWVNNAESETLRMNRLSTLLDSSEAEKTITSQIEQLSKLQTKEGGWSWCPDMEPSAYITRTVLSEFASLTQAGALESLPAARPIVKSAVRFVDEETWKEYTKYHKKDESLDWLLDWLYVRSCFDKGLLPSGNVARNLSSVYSRAEKDIAKEWKDMDIRSKAMAAMLLWRAGNRKTALEILESLTQFASETPEKGVWFDNLTSSFGNASTLQTTTAVLRAFAEIQPKDKIIDGLRQWLVLSRQVQDWGKQRATVETIDAILTSGSDWTNRTDVRAPEFQLRSRPVDIPESAALTGAFTVTLDAKQASGKKLKISRSNSSPAWGGVISQYVAPLSEVKAVEIPNLSIRKETVALVDDGHGSLVPKRDIKLKKGMKVRVTLTITNDRAMEYMALTDERSACLEPADQLSHYTSTDGLWYYKEVRDTQTNLYIEHLPKGHHVISYDCTVAQDGTFSCGIATIQSQYSPLITAHSSASLLTVDD